MPILLVSIGRYLHKYKVEESGESSLLSSLQAPAPVQYAVFDNRTGLLYVVCSDGSPYEPGQFHYLLAVEPVAELFRYRNPIIALPARPIHVTLDTRQNQILVAYNRAPGLSVHEIKPGGGVGDLIASGLSGEAHYPHQVFLRPDAAGIGVVCRGSNPTSDAPELPGSLRIYDVEGRTLVERHVAAPSGGFGFGPRNAIYDHVSSMMYLSLERQNKFIALHLDKSGVSSSPEFTLSSLAGPQTFKPQLAGALRMHPQRRVLYQLNRTHPMSGGDYSTYAGEGENTVVVYRLNDDGKAPRVVQRAPTRGIHPRTISLSDDGRLMAIGNIRTQRAQLNGRDELVAPCISLFSVDDEGLLTFIRRMPVPTDELMIWSSFISNVDLSGRAHAD